jgi:hypothetical protein
VSYWPCPVPMQPCIEPIGWAEQPALWFVTSTLLDKTALLHYLNASLDGPITMSFPEGMDIVFHDLSVTSFHRWVPSIGVGWIQSSTRSCFKLSSAGFC